MRLTILAFAACVAFLPGCSSSGTPAGPKGWNAGPNSTWVNPNDSRETFRVFSGPFGGTLKDLASQTTTDVILKQQVKYRSGVPFSACPGEAGLQTFSPVKPGGLIIEAAFSVQNGTRVLAEYARPAGQAEDPAAVAALAANVCVVP